MRLMKELPLELKTRLQTYDIAIANIERFKRQLISEYLLQISECQVGDRIFHARIFHAGKNIEAGVVSKIELMFKQHDDDDDFGVVVHIEPNADSKKPVLVINHHHETSFYKEETVKEQ